MDILGFHMKRMITLWLMLWGTNVYAQEPEDVVHSVSDVLPQVANLMPSPGRCELKTGQKRCDMQLNLIWEAPKPARYCLWRRGSSQPIKCWDNAWRGSVKLKFSASSKIWFELKNSHNEAVLAQTGVSVTGSYKQRKRAQRRKRGIWRMF